MIVLIASASVLIAYFVARSIFGDVYDGSAKVKTIDRIESSVNQPDPKIFNTDAINPAVPVQIEGDERKGEGRERLSIQPVS